MITDDWRNLYKEGWKNEIIPQAIAHPAKFSRALIRHIYKHAIEQGWLTTGSTVVDPFGGVGLGALDAMRYGMHWTGVELESRFARMAGGHDCPGMSKDDWVRWQGRIGRNPDLCPDCQNGIGLKYEQNSGIIPCKEPHRFVGNIELWNNRYAGKLPNWGTARMLQGDSRHLLEVVQGADASISSPPYAETQVKFTHMTSTNRADPADPHYRPSWVEKMEEGYADSERPYGETPGQLGTLKDDGYDAAIASPPFIAQSGGTNVTSTHGPLADERLLKRHAAGNAAAEGYGDDPANLGNLKPEGFDLAISSPPYAETRIDGNGDEGSSGLRNEDGSFLRGSEGWEKRKEMGERYGDTEGNLGHLKDGGYDAAISSPPFAESNPDGGWQLLGKYAEEGRLTVKQVGGDPNKSYPSWDKDRQTPYAMSPDNLGNMQDQGFDAAISSPPFSQDHPRQDRLKENWEGKGGDGFLHAQGYSQTDGNLGGMPPEGFDATISSPPYADQEVSMAHKHSDKDERLKRRAEGDWEGYNRQNPANLGTMPFESQETDETFWSAARTIIDQTYAALKPGGVAIWVTKSFVKDGKRIDFPGQWQRMCEAAGFVTLHRHKAWLVEDRGSQYDMFGNLIEKTVERKSFFRRLAEKKGSPRIDYEVVTCMIKETKRTEDDGN